ncbi:hypothetical protein LTR37_018853 [Vermiconidia calcicola]|uniref:Uncharacterized protein n=1 Tax=Vermiconidia calcicola TaxID=1690605 RepID=A0ACC3MFV1_9PEZI|nr:hypothetical protein LTR37_018853 [Vermiconidia calcicola]
MPPSVQSQGAYDSYAAARRQLASTQELLERITAAAASAPRPSSPTSIPAVQKVFNISELLEHILLRLSFQDILKAQQVSKQFFNAIEASSTIQKTMCLQPDPTSNYQRQADVVFRSWHLHEPRPPITIAQEKRIFLTAFVAHAPDSDDLLWRLGICIFSENKLPNPGGRIRSTLICQPPVLHMDVYATCCHPSDNIEDRGDPTSTVTSETGITIGDILDTATRLRAEHRLCPFAHPLHHTNEGFVEKHVEIDLEAMMKLPETDPIMLALQLRKRRCLEEWKDWPQTADRLHQYIISKQAALDNGMPIPTLAEFEAVSAEDWDALGHGGES